MRNRLKTWNKVFVNALLTLLLTAGAFEETKAQDNLEEMGFIEMINSVDLGEYSDFIQKFQEKEAKSKLLNGKYNPKSSECTVENYRNKEVLLITIPAHLLFAPNEIDLNAKADEYLAPIKRYLRKPDTYRVLLVMHTDNTGSPEYRDRITEDRVDSVFAWFEDEGCDTSFLFPYAMGDDMPLPGMKNNDSQKIRDKNRRLEIYLVPGTKMLEQAKKGRIEF